MPTAGIGLQPNFQTETLTLDPAWHLDGDADLAIVVETDSASERYEFSVVGNPAEFEKVGTWAAAATRDSLSGHGTLTWHTYSSHSYSYALLGE